MKVVLYDKPGDAKGADALRVLEGLKARHRFELVTSDASADSRFGPRAPVVVADGREIWQGGATADELAKAVSSAAARAGVSRRGKVAFALVAGLSLAGILGLKAHQVFVEPEAAAARYLGIEKVEGPAPDFAFETRDGKTVRLSDLRGKFVFLNYWATWCPTCKTEMPSMAAMLHALRDQPMVAIAATVDDAWEPVDRYLGGEKLPFQVLRDPNQKWANAYGTQKFPETYVIGPDGRLRAKFVGPRDWADRSFELYFRNLLSEVAGSPTSGK